MAQATENSAAAHPHRFPCRAVRIATTIATITSGTRKNAPRASTHARWLQTAPLHSNLAEG